MEEHLLRDHGICNAYLVAFCCRIFFLFAIFFGDREALLLLAMEESDRLAEVIEIELVVDALVDGGLVRLDLGVEHFHESQ